MKITEELYNKIVSDIKDIEIIFLTGYYDEAIEFVFFDKVKQIESSDFLLCR